MRKLGLGVQVELNYKVGGEPFKSTGVITETPETAAEWQDKYLVSYWLPNGNQQSGYFTLSEMGFIMPARENANTKLLRLVQEQEDKKHADTSWYPWLAGDENVGPVALDDDQPIDIIKRNGFWSGTDSQQRCKKHYTWSDMGGDTIVVYRRKDTH